MGLLVPCSASGVRTPSGTEMQKWDLRDGARVMLTGGPGEGYVGSVVGRTSEGHIRLRLPCTREHAPEQGCKCSEYLLGYWWLSAAANGTVPQLPVVNTDSKEELPKAALKADDDQAQRFAYK